MEAQGGGQNKQTSNEESKSPERSKTKLQLPVSCDPPGPANLPKQLVWIVSYHFMPLCVIARDEGSLSIKLNIILVRSSKSSPTIRLLR